jgi:hypothetical protein
MRHAARDLGSAAYQWNREGGGIGNIVDELGHEDAVDPYLRPLSAARNDEIIRQRIGNSANSQLAAVLAA